MVRSTRNRRVADAIRLHRARQRTASGTTLIEGPRLLAEALGAGFDLCRVFCLPADETTRRAAAGVRVETVLVSEAVLGRLATTVEPQSPVAVARIPDAAVAADGHLLVAWGVADPGNVGTLIRSAAAFGLGFVAGPGTADPWSPKVLRSGAGGHFHTTIGRVVAPGDLRALERSLVAAVARGGCHPAEVPFETDVAILVGSEAEGLTPDLIEAADHRVTIPMPGGAESLNAAVAGAVLAYEAVRARPRRPGGGGPARD